MTQKQYSDIRLVIALCVLKPAAWLASMAMYLTDYSRRYGLGLRAFVLLLVADGLDQIVNALSWIARRAVPDIIEEAVRKDLAERLQREYFDA